MNNLDNLKNDIEIIVTYFSGKPNIAAVYMFGSTAKEKHRSISDIDIAVMFKRYLPEKEGLSFLSYVADMEGITDKKIDLVNFNTANPLLRHQIIKYGKVLIDVDTMARVELMVKAMIDYEEYQRYLDFGLEIMQREMGKAEYGERDN